MEAAESRLLYMVAGQVRSIAKAYRRISKCALNMYIDAYISHIPLESLSSHTHLQTCRQGVLGLSLQEHTSEGLAHSNLGKV